MLMEMDCCSASAEQLVMVATSGCIASCALWQGACAAGRSHYFDCDLVSAIHTGNAVALLLVV